MLRLPFSPIYTTGPVSIVLLAIILWGLFSPTRKNKALPESSPKPQPAHEPAQPTLSVQPMTPTIPVQDLSYLADPAYDRFWPESWRDSLIRKGQGLMEQWTTRLDYPEKQRRENDSVNWLSEVNDYARNHLKAEQLEQFLRNYGTAIAPAKKYEFAMALADAGSGGGTKEHDLAFEIACKAKLLEVFRSDLTLPAPQLRMSCHSKIPGCVKETRFTRERIPTNFFRVRVEADGAQSIKNCTAILTSIEKDGRTRWGGDSAKITFAQGEQPDTFAKTIRCKAPEFFDVLAVTCKGEMFPGTYDTIHGRWWPYHPSLPEIFSEHGDYIIAVAVSGDDVPTETATLKFNWTGNWQTSSLTEAARLS